MHVVIIIVITYAKINDLQFTTYDLRFLFGIFK